eukprot:CAMPEP_0114609304 /NCGR_PEP_ID=MMETSP0168-20121206/3019_1 /TAXON_ID=95228 ORGANISM="Vannella sp., Strain DIVA3 517/6/12" /NCGR_SAMPLE_ID=MMETSP0168 /ASSEMBLY_ACC=CAM_ASM_000044 /LENGTH=224 /DNA_ID=CAMNT_0001820217 /DNA_START=23 /DNA_END=697 /DNA_ORIENTATION=-
MAEDKGTDTEAWTKAVSSIATSKKVMNQLVMNYLAVQGYREAALCLHEESGVELPAHMEEINERENIRAALLRGEVRHGSELINDFDAEILDTEQDLMFTLQQQQLIELIREEKLEEALSFAQQELGPRAVMDAAMLDELERTMALLALDTNSAESDDSPLSRMLSVDQRLATADKVNDALLTSLGQDKEPKLSSLLVLMEWAESKLKEKRVAFPPLDCIPSSI